MNEYELYHHGVLGMKWGVRRYQNKDGSLTAAGRRRYGVTHNPDGSMKTELKGDSEITKKVKSDYNKLSDARFKAKYGGSKEKYNKRVKKYSDPYMNAPGAKIAKMFSKNVPKENKRQLKAGHKEDIKEYRLQEGKRLVKNGQRTVNNLLGRSGTVALDVYLHEALGKSTAGIGVGLAETLLASNPLLAGAVVLTSGATGLAIATRGITKNVPEVINIADDVRNIHYYKKNSKKH